MNGASGNSDLEGKAAREAASECGQRASFNKADGISDMAGAAARVCDRAERERARYNQSAGSEKVVGAFVSNAKAKLVVAAAVSATL